jgi:hypothetical protein
MRRDRDDDVELAMTEAEWEQWEREQPGPRPDPEHEPHHPDKTPDESEG